MFSACLPAIFPSITCAFDDYRFYGKIVGMPANPPLCGMLFPVSLLLYFKGAPAPGSKPAVFRHPLFPDFVFSQVSVDVRILQNLKSFARSSY